jgi:hypothetical protein
MRLVDDIDPTVDADRTITFGLAGKHYQIDLSDAHAQQLEAEIGHWAQFARRAGSVPKTLTRPRAAGKDDTDVPTAAPEGQWWRTPPDADISTQEKFKKLRQQIREWGKHNGFPSLGDRGVLPYALYTKWRAHHARQPIPAADTDDAGQAELDVGPEPAKTARHARSTRKAS